MNITKSLVILAALVILSIVAVTGRYQKQVVIYDRKNSEYICNEKNTECDLSNENDEPLLAQAIVRRIDTDPLMQLVTYGKI